MYDYKDLENNMIPARFVSLIAGIDASKALVEVYRSDHEMLFEDLQKSASLMMRKRVYTDRKKSSGFPGYCKVMERIRNDSKEDSFTVHGILKIHREILGNNDSAWRREALPGRVTPGEIIKSLEELCIAYQKAKEYERIHLLLLVPRVLYDFSYIAPFSEGNEVLMEILAQLLLTENGYVAGRYISLEKEKIDKVSWEYAQDGEQAEILFTEQFLLGLKECYLKLVERYDRMKERKPTKKMRIEAIIMESPEPISKAEILKCLPDVSETTVEAHLSVLCKKGMIERLGTLKDAAYRKRAKQETT